MRRYWLPDFQRQLIGELQRQQQSAQFCDTLLQTEGVSIPTHSSVLAALSLHLSQRLSASPPPPAGQKRMVQLHHLKPQTLLKLVGLLYSGELVVNSALEQQDVLAAAQLFGLPDLVAGQKTGGELEPCADIGHGRVELRKWNSQVQMITEVLGKRRVSTGTQTLSVDTKRTTDKSQHYQAAHSSSLPHSCNVSRDTFSSTPCPAIPRILGLHSDGESTLDQSTDSLTNTTWSLLSSNENMTLHLSPSEDSNSSTRLLQGDDIQQNLPESSIGSAKNSLVLVEDETRKEKRCENGEKSSQAYTDGTVGVEKRHVSTNVASKSLEKMQQVMEATQISIKVKLRRRRTKEEMWEVVNIQDAGETLSVVTSLRQDPSTTHVCHIHNSGTSVLQLATSSPKPQPSVASSCCPSDTLNQNTCVVSAPGPVEETDEQFEKLLEDIMIGLNILPSVDKANNKSHDGASAACQVPKDKASYCVCSQDCETQSGHSSKDTAQNRPVCTSLPPAEPSGAGVLIPTQHSSLRGRDGFQNSLYCKSSRSDEASLCGEQQKLHFPACHESTSQEDPNVLEFLPENETQLFSMADLQFPPCLSPLDSVHDYSTSSGNKTPAQSALPGRAWLMENPASLEFPLSTVAQKLNSSESKLCTTDDSCKDTTCHKELHTEETQRGETESPPSNSQYVRYPRKVKRNFKCKPYDVMTNDVAHPDRKRKCTNTEMNETCREVRVRTNTKINLSPCLVSLSSNNPLAQERKRVTSTSETLPNTATVGEPSQRLILTRSISLRAKAKSTGENFKSTPKKTREEMRNTQETSRHTTIENSIPCPSAGRMKIQRKRKRGRPRKTSKTTLTSPDSANPVVEKNSQNIKTEQQIENPNLGEIGEAKQTCRKRKRRRPDDTEGSPLKQMKCTDHSYDPKPDDNNNTNPAEKRPRMVSLKEFQELIKRQHLKTRRSKEKREKELVEAVEREDAVYCGASRTETIQVTENSHSEDVDVTDFSDGQAEISSRQFLNQSGNAPSTSLVDERSRPVTEKNNSGGNEHQSVFSFVVLQEEVDKLSVEKELSLEPSHEETDSANESELNIDDDDSSPLAPQLHRESTVPADLCLNLNNNASDLQEAGSTDRSSGCQQDNDEDEVDVLFHSPDRAPVNTEYNKAVEISPDEEEEEDGNDVDVTGDETDVCIDA